MQTLFEENKYSNQDKVLNIFENDAISKQDADKAVTPDLSESSRQRTANDKPGSLSRIIWFFDDNSFEEYFPR